MPKTQKQNQAKPTLEYCRLHPESIKASWPDMDMFRFIALDMNGLVSGTGAWTAT
jgi:hypothetical protein